MQSSAALKSENVKKCIRMGITVLKWSFGEVNHRFFFLSLVANAFFGAANASP